MSRSSAAQAAAGLHLAAGASDRVGRVQPHGVLLVVSEPDARIVQASAHAGSWLGHPLESILLGPVDRLGGDLGMRLRQRVDRFEPGTGQALALECTLACATGLRPVEVWVHRVGPDLLALDLDARVARCVSIKAGIVAGDERESGRRAILNYGHTLGHALEIASEFQLAHGEAVAIGMMFAAHLARILGRIDDSRVAEHHRVIDGEYGLATTVPKGIERSRLFELVTRDKKAIDGLTFVLDGPRGIETVGNVPRDAVDRAFDALSVP